MAILMSLAQLLGATLGYGLLQSLTPKHIFFSPGSSGTCMTLPHPSLTLTQAFMIEFCLTSALMFMVCGVWDPRNRNNGDSAPLRVGLSIIALSFAGGPATAASMNPARSFAPAFWNGNWDHHWLYWVSPLLAGLVASVFYKVIFWRETPSNEEQNEFEPDGQPLMLLTKSEDRL